MKTLLTMQERVELYITHRRRLGYTYCGTETGLLKFSKWVDQTGYKGPLTTSLATKWAMASKKPNRKTWARRLAYLHGFAKYYNVIDPKTEIPPLNLYGSFRHRPTPYIYSEKEVCDLSNAAQKLCPTDGLKPITFRYLLGLLASTGLRISEAIHLTRQDVDLNTGILTIRESKFHKSRYIPLHKTTQKALNRYVDIRDKKIPSPSVSEFFIIDNTHALNLYQTQKDFRWLREELGWKQKPRLYDFRHTFASQRLLKWHKEGKNLDEMMIYLSIYLGHAMITDTYWYLTAIPELMRIISKKFEQCSNSAKGEH